MQHYDTIDVSERIDVNKTNEPKECNICHYWYSLNKGFKFQTYVCNRCHDLLMMSMNLSDIVILHIKNASYPCIINGIRKCEAVNLLKDFDLTEKSRTLEKFIKLNFKSVFWSFKSNWNSNLNTKSGKL